jgi:parvulin-like peptidyl-prolyl isomerase
MDDTEVDRRLAAAETDKSPIQPVAGAVPGDDTEVFNATVIARVNGAPVFAGEVLERYGDYLRKAREKLPPDEYLELRDLIIRRDLRSHIERRLLVERMKSTLKPDQIKLLDQHIDRAFEEHIAKLKGELNVITRTELELALNERNTSLQALRDSFATERIAMEYLFSSIERPPAATRPEIVAYYQEHLDDYKIPARVKWQQIQISIDGRTARSQAQARLEEAQQELARGTPFDQVARKYSDGPTASDGGAWDWTRSGSLSDTKLEALLFELPVGQVSDVYATRDGFQLIRVIDREAESRTPLADVQDKIAEQIRKNRERDLPKIFVDGLFSEAVIETEYEFLDPV